MSFFLLLLKLSCLDPPFVDLSSSPTDAIPATVGVTGPVSGVNQTFVLQQLPNGRAIAAGGGGRKRKLTQSVITSTRILACLYLLGLNFIVCIIIFRNHRWRLSFCSCSR